MIKQPLSPLRYPGGKAALAPFVGYLCESFARPPREYAEPFTGGAGVGLYLLQNEYVERIYLNDLDRRIWAFWHGVLYETEAFIDRVCRTPVSIASWHEQRTVLDDDNASLLDQGFAAFFLNRTNRSGILGARPIGGLDQTGKWKIDARYHTAALIERIRRLGRYRNRVRLSCQDGAAFVAQLDDAERVFVYADPPYLSRGAELYMNAMQWSDHVSLADEMRSHSGPWMVTYDDDERVETLYLHHAIARYRLKHTAGRQRVGTEIAVFSSGMPVNHLMALPSGDGEWLRPPAAAV